MGLHIIRHFCTLSSNRNYMILTNQLTVLNTLLSCLLGKEERKVGLECLSVLNELLGSSIKGRFLNNLVEADQVVSTTLELLFCSQLLRKIRINLESCASEEGLSDE